MVCRKKRSFMYIFKQIKPVFIQNTLRLITLVGQFSCLTFFWHFKLFYRRQFFGCIYIVCYSIPFLFCSFVDLYYQFNLSTSKTFYKNIMALNEYQKQIILDYFLFFIFSILVTINYVQALLLFLTFSIYVTACNFH